MEVEEGVVVVKSSPSPTASDEEVAVGKKKKKRYLFLSHLFPMPPPSSWELLQSPQPPLPLQPILPHPSPKKAEHESDDPMGGGVSCVQYLHVLQLFHSMRERWPHAMEKGW